MASLDTIHVHVETHVYVKVWWWPLRHWAWLMAKVRGREVVSAVVEMQRDAEAVLAHQGEG